MDFYRYLLIFLLFINYNIFSQSLDSNFTLVIDPGHGGKDPGNTGNGYLEKKIALSIGLKIGDRLKKYKNLKVIYTRKTDIFVDLYRRAKIANDVEADLFISIHCDAHTSNAYGAGTFVLGLHANERNFKIAQKENSVIFLEDDYQQKYAGFDPNNPESVISLVLMQEDYLDKSIVAANFIQKSFVNRLKRRDRTVKQAGFLVLRNTYMPSVLVETGFLTNKTEGSYLNSKKGQNEMADAISEAIINYFEALDDLPNINRISEEIEKNIDIYQFKIQISASKKLLPLKKYNFNGLSNLSVKKVGSIYKYFYGSTSNYNEAKKLLRKSKTSGYKSSFIILEKNGETYDLEKYLNEL